jgi:hypothetical protein
MNDYQWKMLLYSLTIFLTVFGCSIILYEASYYNAEINNYRQYDSISYTCFDNLYNNTQCSCYVYGKNIEYAKMCAEYANKR